MCILKEQIREDLNNNLLIYSKHHEGSHDIRPQGKRTKNALMPSFFLKVIF